jgi:hypothetical protein
LDDFFLGDLHLFRLVPGNEGGSFANQIVRLGEDDGLILPP